MLKILLVKIVDIQKKNRPREKLIEKGVEFLSNQELIAILLRTGIPGLNAIELGKKIIDILDKKGFENLKMDDLLSIKGLGQAKSAEILAAIEIGKRYLSKTKREIILTPKEVWDTLTDIRSAKKEHFIVIFLDAKNSVIVREIVSIGTLTASLVHPREVFEPAIKQNAVSIILAHNHPSGNLLPSDADITVTTNLIQAGKILGIKVIDHVIVSNDSFFSFREQMSEIFND